MCTESQEFSNMSKFIKGILTAAASGSAFYPTWMSQLSDRAVNLLSVCSFDPRRDLAKKSKPWKDKRGEESGRGGTSIPDLHTVSV